MVYVIYIDLLIYLSVYGIENVQYKGSDLFAS